MSFYAFEFMEYLYISVETKANFFEARVSEYSKAGVGDTEDDRKFELDADF